MVEEHHGNRSWKTKAMASRAEGDTLDIHDCGSSDNIILSDIKVIVFKAGILLNIIDVPPKE